MESETGKSVNRKGEFDEDAIDFSSEDNHSKCVVSRLPDNTKSWTPICEDDKRPRVGMVFSTVESGYNFYKMYASVCGFDVRRGTETKHSDGTILRKHFYCAKAGPLSGSFDTLHTIRSPRMRKRSSNRTNCKAFIKLKFNGPNRYIVAEFVEFHNHGMSSKVGSQFLMCRRNLSFVHQSFIMHCSRVNIGPVKAYNLFKQLAGGFENVGAQKAEYKIFSRDVISYIGDSDAQMVIDRLQHKKQISSEFYFEYVEEKGVLTRLFWADPISRRNYYAFGDVVSFDATYGSNKYEMIFVPFTGVDNNKNSVTFGAALLSNEEYKSYVWLLEAFAKCMGRHPKVVLTDEDKALNRAVPEVFPEVHHRHCMWHIMKKFSMKVGCNAPRFEEFRKKLKAVVYNEYLETTEFEKQWHSVLNEYGMENNKWLTDKFAIRSFWIPAYFRDIPLGGRLNTTSRTESKNSFFGRYVNAGMTLVSFFFGFEIALESQRHATMKCEHESRTKVPKTLTPLNIEKDARNVYSHAIFNEIQNEIHAACFDVSIQSATDEDGCKKYDMMDKRYRRHIFHVCVNDKSSSVACCCMLFERVGYLCRHAFLGLKSAVIDRIPAAYVLTRWTKNAVQITMQTLDLQFKEQYESFSHSNKSLSDLWMEFQACISLVGNNVQKVDCLLDKLREWRQHLECETFGDENVDKNKVVSHLLGVYQPTEASVRAPSSIRTKGCGRRIIGEYEKALEKSKRTSRRCKACGELGSHDSRNCPLKDL